MRNKMITLCPTSYEIAKKMPNFSAWVRANLLTLSDKPTHLLTTAAPLPKNYMCKHCLALEEHWSNDCKVIK